MNESATLEKSISALVVMAIITIAFGPFVAAAWQLPYTEKPFLLIALGFPLLAAGLLYDSAERFLGKGRGLYAVAILCSLPATGFAATDLSFIAACALQVMVVASISAAVRAQGAERPAFLVGLGSILLIAGFFFRLNAMSLAFVFAAALTTIFKPKSAWTAALLISLYMVGSLAGLLLPFSIPGGGLGSGSDAFFNMASLLSILPWMLFIIPAIFFLLTIRPFTWTWQNMAAVSVFLCLLLTILMRANLVMIAAGLAPLIALLGTDFSYRNFNAPPRRFAGILAFLAWISIIVLIGLPILTAIGVVKLPALTPLYAVAAILLAAGLVWTQSFARPRWTFFLLFAVGVLLGRLCDWHEPLFPDPENVHAVVSLPFVLVLIAAVSALSILVWLLTRRLRVQANREPDNEFIFAEENLRRFDESAAGVPVSLKDCLCPPYSFVLFGDVTGAESPLSSSRGGFFMFRTLTRILQESRPAFAVSLGDLANDARDSSYRKVKRLVRRIPVPFTVTPGNHDLFVDTKFDAACFHSLFGADNAVFEYGSVRFILLNNARGFIHPQQWEWLEQVFTLPPSSFTLVFCHKPVFELRSVVFYAMETREDADKLHELFRARGVTAVFSGHIHSLLHETRDEVAYVISGGGGSKLTTAHDRYHYLVVDVSENEIIVRAWPLELRRDSAAAPLMELRFGSRS
ncbi:hypothetical protein EHM69_05805 [candidate division KSB1 bacterium]|nr:MAG: hypothetical protein EHM69_05805 [candidate division KSB1 bacterium]